MKKQIYNQFAFALIIVALLASTVSAAGTIGFLFFDATSEDSWTMNDGDNVGIIISADSLLETSMTIDVDLINFSTGNKVADLYNINTNSDSHSHFYNLNKGIYTNAGNYVIKLTVTGASGDISVDELFLTVEAPTPGNSLPVITSQPLSKIKEDSNYAYQVVATDANGDSLTYSMTQNPSWLSMDSSGLISGTSPNVSQDTQYIVTVQVSDGKDSVSQIYTIDVIDTTTTNPPTNNAPVITSSPSLQVNERSNYAYQVVATDANGDSLTYSMTQNPSWLSISSNGLISGTAPSVSSNTPFSVEVLVSDGNGGLTTQSYTLTVKNVAGGGSGSRASGGGSGTKFLYDDSFENQKYLDQFNPKTVIFEEDGEQKTVEKRSLSKIFFISLALLCLLLIIVLIILALRRFS